MHSLFLFVLAAPLALADDLSKRSLLLPRQGSDAFRPSTSGYTASCQYPCGESVCLIPTRGDVCCAEGYGCPGGNFCLTQGYCCPNGDDPATCAAQYGITLPASFQPGPKAVSSPPSSTPTPSPPPAPTTTPTPSPASTTPPTAPFPTPVTNATLSPTGTGAPGETSIVPFTGGAVRFAIDDVIVVSVFVGAAAAAVGLLM